MPYLLIAKNRVRKQILTLLVGYVGLANYISNRKRGWRLKTSTGIVMAF